MGESHRWLMKRILFRGRGKGGGRGRGKGGGWVGCLVEGVGSVADHVQLRRREPQPLLHLVDIAVGSVGLGFLVIE